MTLNIFMKQHSKYPTSISRPETEGRGGAGNTALRHPNHATNAMWFAMLVAAIPLLMLINLAMGSVSVPFSEVVSILLGNSAGDDTVWRNIVLHTRLPQTVTALFCGAGLSVAGLLMQTVFRNPLAGPSVLGVSSAASLGVAFAILLSGSLGGTLMHRFGVVGNAALTFSAIAGAMTVMLLIAFLANRLQGKATLLIVGVMIGYIASAVTGVMKYFSSEEEVRAYVVWGLGSFSRVTGGQVYVFASLIAIFLPFTLLLAKWLNIMLLGEMYAISLGLDIRRARTVVIIVAGTLTAIVTAYCGPIMFLGLAVPHICRGLLRSADHRLLLPATMLCGASIALLCNLIARLPGLEGALPVNSVTALIGAPITLWILLRRKK